MNEWLNIEVLTDILGSKEDTILKRIKRGKYTQTRQVPGHRKDGRSAGRNGLIWQVNINDPAIPAEARERYLTCRGRELATACAASGEPLDTTILKSIGVNPESETVKSAVTAGRKNRKRIEQESADRRRMLELSLARFNQLPEKRQRPALARRELLKARAAFCLAAGKKADNTQWGGLFVKEYNAGRVDLPAPVREEIPQTTLRTLRRWQERYDEGGMYALADGYVSRAGGTTLTDEQQRLAIAMQVEFPGCSAQKVADALEARRMPAGYHAVARFVTRWKKEHASLLLFMTNPDEWKNRHMFAFGDASEEIQRLNQLWEMDSTPGDIMLIDGRHTVIGCIDIHSRRPRLLVSPSSKATAVAALMRRCVLEWGVPEGIKTDNGKDYVAAHIERILEALQVEHLLCPPFTPEAKPHIERFLGVFSHGIVELLPGYIGHSVADRKAIEARKSFAQRLMTSGETVEVSLTSVQLQEICDRWVDAVYMHDRHGGLDGKTPAEMVREWTAPIRVIEDPRALDVLLHPAHKDGGYRVIGKKGVTIDCRHYMADEFAGMEGDRVRVAVDDTDLAHAYIFSETGEFLCVAECPGWKDISAADLAAHAKATQKALMAEQRRELKELTRQAKARTVPEDILAYREERIATIVEFPKQTTVHVTPALEEAAKAVMGRQERPETPPERIELPPEVLEGERRREELHRQKVVSLAESRKMRDIQKPADIYYMILDRIKDQTVTAYQLQWKKDFEYWEETTKKTGLMKADPYCFNDPEEKETEKKTENQ
jgi:hypothetical protein